MKKYYLSEDQRESIVVAVRARATQLTEQLNEKFSDTPNIWELLEAEIQNLKMLGELFAITEDE